MIAEAYGDKCGTRLNDDCDKNSQPKSGVQQEIELIDKNLAMLNCVSNDLYEKLYNSGLLLSPSPCSTNKCEEKDSDKSPIEYKLRDISYQIVSIGENLESLIKQYRG